MPIQTLTAECIYKSHTILSVHGLERVPLYLKSRAAEAINAALCLDPIPPSVTVPGVNIVITLISENDRLGVS